MQQSEMERIEAMFSALRAEIHALGNQPQTVTLKAAAGRLSIGLTKLRALVREGQLLTTRIGRTPMISVAELDAYVVRNTHQAHRPAPALIQRRKLVRSPPKR